MKTIGKKFVVLILGWQVRRLCKQYKPHVIGVVGSIGKTSTKLAIAESLSTQTTVRYQAGNYNDLVSVPLVFFGHTMPSLLNPLAWLRIFAANERMIRVQYPYKVVVLEIGTDGPGQIAAFKRYLHLNAAVVTAITPEHMEYFADLDVVAQEELSVAQYADTIYLNADLVKERYRQHVPNAQTYAVHQSADHTAEQIRYSGSGVDFVITHDTEETAITLAGFSLPHVYSALAAATVAQSFGVASDQLQHSLSAIKPVPGRMQRLIGIKNSTIIDDSYNASPEAVKTALDTVYRIDAPQKIVLLGNMNELGASSPASHTDIGEYCDPTKLTEVITLGPDANEYLAPAAKTKGCRVASFESPFKAGEYIASILQENGLVLIKGSQNRVFAEEAIKPLLANPEDAKYLVRQSADWIAIKKKQFTD